MTGPLSTFSNFHCMQLRLPHHIERDMVDDTLPHSDAREVIDILRVASSWQEYHPLYLFKNDAE